METTLDGATQSTEIIIEPLWVSVREVFLAYAGKAVEKLKSLRLVRLGIVTLLCLQLSACSPTWGFEREKVVTFEDIQSQCAAIEHMFINMNGEKQLKVYGGPCGTFEYSLNGECMIAPGGLRLISDEDQSTDSQFNQSTLLQANELLKWLQLYFEALPQNHIEFISSQGLNIALLPESSGLSPSGVHIPGSDAIVFKLSDNDSESKQRTIAHEFAHEYDSQLGSFVFNRLLEFTGRNMFSEDLAREIGFLNSYSMYSENEMFAEVEELLLTSPLQLLNELSPENDRYRLRKFIVQAYFYGSRINEANNESAVRDVRWWRTVLGDEVFTLYENLFDFSSVTNAQELDAKLFDTFPEYRFITLIPIDVFNIESGYDYSFPLWQNNHVTSEEYHALRDLYSKIEQSDTIPGQEVPATPLKKKAYLVQEIMKLLFRDGISKDQVHFYNSIIGDVYVLEIADENNKFIEMFYSRQLGWLLEELVRGYKLSDEELVIRRGLYNTISNGLHTEHAENQLPQEPIPVFSCSE